VISFLKPKMQFKKEAFLNVEGFGQYWT